MINKLVKKTVYFSLFAQVITTIISLDGLRYNLLNKDKILQNILILEALVQIIEAIFYIWVIYALDNLNIMTSRRYIDWFITTPTMLISTIIFMDYINKKENNQQLTLTDFIKYNYDNIKLIVFYNFMMLLFGLLGELNIINNKITVFIGFIFFYKVFELIYKDYVNKNNIINDYNYKLFLFMVSVWSLYGIAALLSVVNKNIMYNLLDIISKNFYGLFIYFYIKNIGYL